MVTISTAFRMISPLLVTTYLRGNIPLLESYYPVIILYDPTTHKEVTLIENLQRESSRAFILNNTLLSCRVYSYEKTKCTECFCNRQQINE